MDNLHDFLTESLRIEGIMRPPLLPETAATEVFLKLPVLSIEALTSLVRVFQPNAGLRSRVGMDVFVGNHVPPKGGPQIIRKLTALLVDASTEDSWSTHIKYEALHPYQDGNGRSGRAIWLWQRLREGHACPRSFLHMFYYQTLDAKAR